MIVSADARRRCRWNWKDDAFLRRLYPTHSQKECAVLLGRGPKAVASRAKVLRLRRKSYKPWLPKDHKRLRSLYPHISTKKVAAILGRSVSSINGQAAKLGLKKTAEYMASPSACRLRHGDNVGAAFRFKPGHVPANKGLRRPGWSVGRMAETQFKKGNRPHSYLPVGTIKANADGYLRVKISDAPEPLGARGAKSANWEFVHKRVWEAAHGPVPKGHRIWWKDGNHNNCSLENLELLSDKKHMARTTIHRLPPELKSALIVSGKLKRKIREIERGEKKQHHRVAQASV